jgi:hypothetical protein
MGKSLEEEAARVEQVVDEQAADVTQLSAEERAVLWAKLCEEADNYVADYLIWADEQCSRQHPAGYERNLCVEMTIEQLWKRRTSRHYGRPSLVEAWWQRHVPNDWKRAMEKWKKEAQGRLD